MSACAPGPIPRSSSLAPQPSSAPKRVTAALRSSPNLLFFNKLNLGSSALGVSQMERLMHAGLAFVEDNAVLGPQLAREVPSLENGQWRLFADGRMETTWRILPEAAWHDGTPFTSADVLFTASLGQETELPVFRDIAFDSLERVEAPDPLTVVAYWSRPYVEADAMFTHAHALPLPRHLLERAYREDKVNFSQHPFWSQEFVGTGAYRLRELVRDSHLVLEANDRYVLGRPKIDVIEVRFFPDPNTVMANILAGEAELTFDARTLSFEQALQLRDQWRDGKMQLSAGSWVTIYPQLLNPTPPVVADVGVRRALLMAVDRQAMVDSIQAGLSAVAHTENSWSGTNRTRYRNPEMDNLINRYFVTIPRAERTDVLRRIIHHMTDQVLLLGLFYDPEVTMVGNRLRNVIPGSCGTPTSGRWCKLRVGHQVSHQRSDVSDQRTDEVLTADR